MQTPAQIVRLVDSALTLAAALPERATSSRADIPADRLGQLIEATTDYAGCSAALSAHHAAITTVERPDGTVDPALLFGGDPAPAHITPEARAALDAATERHEGQLRRAAERVADCYRGVALPLRDDDIPGVSTVSPAQIVEIGEALYGPTWQTAMARGLQIEDRTVRRWVAAARNGTAVTISSGIHSALMAIAAERRDAIDAMLARDAGA